MASRDGFVNLPLSIPEELKFLVELYRKDMKIVSFNGALRMLLETHPEIDKRAQEIYAGVVMKPTGEDVPS